MGYCNWKISGETISAEGEGNVNYIHYCPLEDFIYVVETIVDIASNEGCVSQASISDFLEGKTMPKGGLFLRKKQRYKVNMVFQFLKQFSFLKENKKFVPLKKYKGAKNYGITSSAHNIKKFIYNINS
jgi:hypothetical protein